MTRILLAAIALGLLAGCAAVPTLQHCQHVEYVRTGNTIKIVAECQAPVGSGFTLPGV